MKHMTRFHEKRSTLVLEVLIFIPAMSLAAAMLSHMCWRPDSEEAHKINKLPKATE